uniref:Secreted protein n=1 Tax=Arundo donax TaxID=35708 RepID=A0A0A9BJ96_ARUDO
MPILFLFLALSASAPTLGLKPSCNSGVQPLSSMDVFLFGLVLRISPTTVGGALGSRCFSSREPRASLVTTGSDDVVLSSPLGW